MSWFAILLIILLAVSITNNLYMYSKCYSSGKLNKFKISNVELNENMGVANITLVYNKLLKDSKCHKDESTGYVVYDNVSRELSKIHNNYPKDSVIIIDEPTVEQIEKLKLMAYLLK
jgi:hypothetical protein